MQEFNTIHIFGFGTAQIITQSLNKAVPVFKLSLVAPLVASLTSLKPADVSSVTYHSINIDYGVGIRYLGRCTRVKTDKLSFYIKWSDVNLDLLSALVDEIISA